jgi:hypothetical protein
LLPSISSSLAFVFIPGDGAQKYFMAQLSEHPGARRDEAELSSANDL